MTINSTTRKAGPFVGNGTVSAFPFGFKVFQASDLFVVRLNVSAAVEQTLVLNSDYSVTLNPDQNSNPGGVVTLLNSALAAGYTLTLTSDVPDTQPTDLTNQGGFYPEVINDALDRATIQIQQLQEETGRTIKAPISTPAGTNLTFPMPNANKVIGWNSTATGLQNFDPNVLASIVAFATAYTDTFNGDGITSTFALSYPPGTVRNLDVSINGVTQVPVFDYNINGQALSFVAPPPLGSVVLAKYWQALPNSSGAAQDFTLNPNGYTTANDVQEGFDDLGSNAGANKVGFLSAGAGAISRTVQAKLRDVVHVADFGADGTQAGDSAALKAAIAYAATNWLPVILPARRFYWDGTTITEDKVRIWGSGMPCLNAGKTALEGGTIIQGGLLFTGDYIDLRDFGVDIGSASGVASNDAIKCLAQPYNTGKTLHTENLIGLCDSPASAVHALLFEGYAQHTGGNLHGVYGFFGVVIKNRNVQLTTLKATDSSDTGVYFKSDNLYGQCSDVQVDAIEVVGATPGAVDYAVRLQADSAVMDNIQIGKIRAQGHGTSLLVQTLDFVGAAFGSAYVGSIISEGATTDDVFVFNLKPSGELRHVEIGSVISIEPAAKTVNLLCDPGAEIDDVRIGSIYASYALGTAAPVLDGAVFIGGGVLRSQIGSASLLVDYDTTTLGALNYASAGDDHLLGMRTARVIGPGRPSPGYSVQTLSGATATLVVPNNDAGTRTSLVKLTHAAPITITTFAATPSGNTALEFGHILTLFNASSHTVTVNNNAPGNILNPGYLNVTLGENEVRSWVIGDDNVWRGLP